jgi:hypothetical protein
MLLTGIRTLGIKAEMDAGEGNSEHVIQAASNESNRQLAGQSRSFSLASA